MDMLSAPMGTKIIFSDPDAGYQIHMDKAKKHLTVGNEYTLWDRDIQGSSAEIWVSEVPGVSFNSVSFEISEDINVFEVQNYFNDSSIDKGCFQDKNVYSLDELPKIIMKALSYKYEIMIINNDKGVPMTLYYAQSGAFGLDDD